MYIIGVDAGTTHIKACLMDKSFRLISTSVENSSMVTDAGIGKCYDPEDLWNTVKSCIRKSIQGIDPLDVAAIGITSMAESGVPVDEKGNTLFPIIPWGNTTTGSAAFPGEFDGFELYRKTGLIDHPKYTVHRLLWMKYEKPGIFENMYRWLSVSDYILYKLTGRFVTDNSLACRTMLFNIERGRWDDELVSLSGMEGRLPDVINTGEAAGTITKAAAEELGISEDVKAVPAGHDHLSAAVAADIEAGQKILNSMGTSEVYAGFRDNLNLSKECYNSGIMQGCFGGKFYWLANIPASGGTIEWLKDLFYPMGTADYKVFADNPKIKAPSGLLYYPYLNGSGTPHVDPLARGAFLGLSSNTTQEDMIQAVYEGIAMESRWILDTLKDCLNIHAKKVIAVGGGTKNRYMMQTKANILESEVYCSSLHEAASLGAAVQAANAVFEGGDHVADQSVEKVGGDTKLKDYYDKKYKKYKDTFNAIKGESIE